MRAEIISIGTEILVGSILNTNTQYLSKKLAENAIDVYHHVTVGDNIPRILDCLEKAAARADLILTSGGLGPTEDDVTVEAISRFLKTPLFLHRPTEGHIRRVLKKLKLPFDRLVQKQCYLLKGSFIFKNDAGTAPGVLCSGLWRGKKIWVLALPGPPKELEPMFEKKALPCLLTAARVKKEHFLIRTVRVTSATEAEVAVKVKDLLKMKPPLTVGIYAKPCEVELKIMAKAASVSSARSGISRIEGRIKKRLGKKIYGFDGETLASAVGKLLRDQGKTLALAESCTGGLLSHLVTETPGSSDYFIGSVVAYSDRVKTSALGVAPRLLKKYGAVSCEAAVAMAKNVREKFRTDYGMGLTGIAGPGGGSALKPVGLVYIALAGKNKNACFKNLFFGTRSEIKSRAAHNALDLLRLNA